MPSFRRKGPFQQRNQPQGNKKMPMPGEGLPRYLHYNADQSGCGFWRMIHPGNALLSYNKAVVMTQYQMILDPNFYVTIDTVRLQRQCTEMQHEFVKHLRQISREVKNKTGKGFKIMWEVDDVVCPIKDIPEYNRCKDAFTNPQINDTVKRIVHYCDEVTVVSPRMAEHYREYLSTDKVSVIPNYLPKNWLDGFYDPKKAERLKDRKKIRVGYAGSGTHFDIANKNGQKDDFWHVLHTVMKYVDDVEWVFFGGMPLNLKPYIDRGRIQFVPWGNLNDYPRILDSLDLDVMIAPLAQNAFTESKSNIKFLEGATQGIPVICQDLPCYDLAPWKFNTGDEMMDLIRQLTHDENTYAHASKTAREISENYWLEDHLDEYLAVYNTPYAHPVRKNLANFAKNNEHQFQEQEIPVHFV